MLQHKRTQWFVVCGWSELSAIWRPWKWKFLSVAVIWLSKSDGDIREGSKQSKADIPPLRDSKSPCWYLLHVIQNKSWDSTGNSSGEANTKLHENVSPFSVTHKKFNLYWQHFSVVFFFLYKRAKETKQKSQTFPHISLSQQPSLICVRQSWGFKPPLHEFIMKPNDFCAQRKRWRTTGGGEKKNGRRVKK